LTLRMSDLHFSAGMEAFLDEDPLKAVDEFSKAIELDEIGSLKLKILLHRSHAYFKLNKHTESLQDANQALLIDPSSESAYFRKGVAAFELGEFETSLAAFIKGRQFLDGNQEPPSRPYDRWIRKCETEIEDDGEQTPPVQCASHNNDISTSHDSLQMSEPRTFLPTSTLKYQFYQSASDITVSVMEKNVKSDELNVEITDLKLSVSITRLGNEVSE